MTRKDASRLALAALVTLAISLGAFALSAPSQRARSGALTLQTPRPHAVPASTLPEQALAFEPTADGRYLVRDQRYALAVGARGTLLSAGAQTMRTQIVGGRRGRVAPSQRQSLVVNRYHGNTAKAGIPTFGQVTYRGVYPGIDLSYHGRGAQLEYDFLVRRGADPARIELALRGATQIRLDSAGNLVANRGPVAFRQHAPVAYQRIAGSRRPVSARFVLAGNRVRIKLGNYDHHQPLVIDPTLTYSDFIGGSKSDGATRLAVDGSGNIYVVGQTASASIPGTSGTRSGTDLDAFVLKIAPDHSRQWITYLGGTGSEAGNDIGLDDQGRPYIVGSTASTDFPNNTLFGPQDSFTAALNTDGSLRWAKTLGTQDTTNAPLVSYGYAIAVQGDGTSYIALSGQGPPGGYTIGFVIPRDSDGVWNNQYVTPDGSSNTTGGTSLVTGVGVKPGCTSSCTVFYTGEIKHSQDCGPAGTVQMTGAFTGAWNFAGGSSPWSSYFPYFETCTSTASDTAIPNALDVTNHGDPVIIGTDYPPNGSTAKPHTFFARYDGTNGTFDPLGFTAQTDSRSDGYDISHDAADNLIIAGTDTTVHGDLNAAVQSTYNGGADDGTIYKINPDGPPGGTHDARSIVWATLFGGTSDDQITGVATDNNGNVYFDGSTQSLSKFPTQGTTQSPGIAGAISDGFIAIIRPNTPTITAGPSGAIGVRDAKFTFNAAKDPNLPFSADEDGAAFQCKLAPRDADFGPCPADGSYTGLADGSYTFAVRDLDLGGTVGGVATRDFQVDTTPHANFTIAPNPVLVGRPVTFDASASTAATPITKYEWDLDGDGKFETQTGTTASASQVYPTAKTVPITLRITDSDGKTTTQTNDLHVNTASDIGTQFGVTINHGAQFTNDPHVTVTSTFPVFTTGLLLSNDGGFGKGQRFDAKKDTAWLLDSSGPERLPKTIYVRFLTGVVSGETHQDDIILDEIPPVVTLAVVDSGDGTSSSAATESRLHKFKVKLKARDSNSGVAVVQLTANKKKPGKAVKYKKKLVVKAAKKPKWVRARDRAGNWSKWKKMR